MVSSSIVYMAAGLVSLSVTSAQSGYELGRVERPRRSRLPRWLPYVALAVPAVGSTIIGILYPEAIGANLD